MVSELKILGVILKVNLQKASQSNCCLILPRGGLVFWGRQWVFFQMSLLSSNSFRHPYSLCRITLLQFQLWSVAQGQSGISVWLVTLCVVYFLRSICWWDQPVELLLLTLDILRWQGLITCQFSRSFVHSCVRLWNWLHESVFAGGGLGAFP